MNNNIKAQFFAQYFQQVVFRNKHWAKEEPNESISPYILNSNTELSEGFLELRTVAQLNQDELLQVGIKAFPMFVPFPEKDYDTLRKLALTVLDRGHLSWVTRQTLIGYGALVPFLYLDENNKPVSLSPAELINLGWVVIKE